MRRWGIMEQMLSGSNETFIRGATVTATSTVVFRLSLDTGNDFDDVISASTSIC